MRRFSTIQNGNKDRINSVASVGKDHLSRSSPIGIRLKRNCSLMSKNHVIKTKRQNNSYLDEEIHYDSKYLNMILERNNLIRGSINTEQDENKSFKFLKFLRSKKKQSKKKPTNTSSKKSSTFESSKNSQISLEQNPLNLRHKILKPSFSDLKQQDLYIDRKSPKEDDISAVFESNKQNRYTLEANSFKDIKNVKKNSISNEDEIQNVNFDYIMPYNDINN